MSDTCWYMLQYIVFYCSLVGFTHTQSNINSKQFLKQKCNKITIRSSLSVLHNPHTCAIPYIMIPLVFYTSGIGVPVSIFMRASTNPPTLFLTQ